MTVNNYSALTYQQINSTSGFVVDQMTLTKIPNMNLSGESSFNFLVIGVVALIVIVLITAIIQWIIKAKTRKAERISSQFQTELEIPDITKSDIQI